MKNFLFHRHVSHALICVLMLTVWTAYQKYDPAVPQVNNWPEGANAEEARLGPTQSQRCR